MPFSLNVCVLTIYRAYCSGFFRDDSFARDFHVGGMKRVVFESLRGRIRRDEFRENHYQVEERQNQDSRKSERPSFKIAKEFFHCDIL